MSDDDVSRRGEGPHRFPGVEAVDRGSEFFTSNCAYGCGAFLGGSTSAPAKDRAKSRSGYGDPRGVGTCPNNLVEVPPPNPLLGHTADGNPAVPLVVTEPPVDEYVEAADCETDHIPPRPGIAFLVMSNSNSAANGVVLCADCLRGWLDVWITDTANREPDQRHEIIPVLIDRDRFTKAELRAKVLDLYDVTEAEIDALDPDGSYEEARRVASANHDAFFAWYARMAEALVR